MSFPPPSHAPTDGGRGRKDGRKTYLDLALREPTQVMRAVVLEASRRERARGIHACPIMTCAPRQIGKASHEREHGIGGRPLLPIMYTPFGDDGLECG